MSACAKGHVAMGMIQQKRSSGINTHIPMIGVVIRIWERGSSRVLEEDVAVTP